MRDKYEKTDRKLKRNFMNIIAYRTRQKFSEHGYYIGEDMLYKKSMTHFG
jgi:hypothetical protein